MGIALPAMPACKPLVMWLAGHCAMRVLALVGDNMRGFARVEGLVVENWRKG
ncbi:MAG: hypothetical protein QM533_07395 [Cytophagales bacterium]|nr:hypothetical protein [Cytophagales bacterium]